jgi:lysophospholipase L1-like esterase
MIKNFAVALFLFLFPALLKAQDGKPPFYDDIQAFKKQDSIASPPKKAILFIGSSSFTMWKDVQKDFPSHTIINRGFGGSTLLDQLRYVEDIVYPYAPRQVVIYCGENDLAASDTVTAALVFQRFRKLFRLIRSKYPRAGIAYVSMKPSPSRVMLLGKMREGNELIREFLRGKKNTAYVDVYKAMVDGEGRPYADIFLDDNLHMNEKGYAIWKRLIEPHLLK